MKRVKRWSLVSLCVMCLVAAIGAVPGFGQETASALPADRSDAALVAWLDKCDIESLNVDDAIWLAGWMVPRGVLSNKFSVRWTGTLTVPTEGTYTFSACPMNLNTRGDGNLLWQTMAVWIDDQQVLDTTQGGGDWASQGTPAKLSAGAKVPIRVDFSYEAVGVRGLTAPAIAMLLWEGPGRAKELVPRDVLTRAEGQSGLDAVYRLSVGDQQQVFQQVEPEIDHVWFENDPVVPEDAVLRRRLADRLGTLVTDPAYLKSCEGGERPLIRTEARLLSSAHRRALLQGILAQPSLAPRIPVDTVVYLYAFCRPAAPQEAVDFLGGVMQIYPDYTIDSKDRVGYWALGRTVWQDPPRFARFEDRYLVMADGRCCLPVGYLLTYGYWTEGRLEEWIQRLEARLADQSLLGDKRAGWLLVRAVAEELQGSRPGRSQGPKERILAGRAWLEEACLAAQTEPMRLRAYQELAMRLASSEQIDGATEVLDRAAGKFSEPATKAALEACRSEIGKMGDRVREQHAQQETDAQDAYRKALERRRAKAPAEANQ